MHRTKITAEAEEMIQTLTDKWGDARQTKSILAVTARKAIGHLRQGRFDYDAMIMPRREHGRPPKDINVYADGGLTAPTNQHFSIPAAGVFIKNRFHLDDGDDAQLEPAEAQFENSYKQQRGRCTRLAIPGLINSSTRSEGHGLLVALCTKGPLHIGIDNKAVVGRACRLIDLATNICRLRDDDVAMQTKEGYGCEIVGRMRKPEAKHWKLQKDGDVWQAIWRLILAKGPEAIKVTKVKGHATDEDVREGVATAADKAGNDVADSIVREANALHGKATIDLAHWLEKRHTAYCTMMGEVQQIIIRMLSLDKEERDRRRQETDPFGHTSIPKLLIPISLQYDAGENSRVCNIKDCPQRNTVSAGN